jgi:8-oxo-dGTP pyrophosphatase MutT (NUDIX family)
VTGRHVVFFHESAGAVVMITGRCLALRRADRDEWVLPKGHLEDGERPEDAAIREVREETGLEIEVLAPLGMTRYEFGSRREHHKQVRWFLARTVGGQLKTEARFAQAWLLDRDEAQSILSHEADRRIVGRLRTCGRGLTGGDRMRDDAFGNMPAGPGPSRYSRRPYLGKRLAARRGLTIRKGPEPRPDRARRLTEGERRLRLRLVTRYLVRTMNSCPAPGIAPLRVRDWLLIAGAVATPYLIVLAATSASQR